MNRHHNKVGGRKTRKQHENKELNKNALRLKTLLKLPKAHKWVIYEWFYGNLDQSLFKLNQESEFQLCLKELFPHLKTNNLKRPEWTYIRRLMGKPRRCSPAYLIEERQSLNAKRDKIRQIQHQQKLDTLSNYHDLPNLIPMPLVIGTRITALQRKPHDGLFNGSIEAVDILNGTYRIAFDRSDIAADTVLDHDVRSIAPTEFMPLQAFLYKSRPPNPHNLPVYTPAKLMEMINEQETSPFDNTNDQTNELNDTNQTPYNNPYQIKLLAKLVRSYKILDYKRRRVYELKMMNNEIEKIRSNSGDISYEIQKEYANTVLDLDKLNKCLVDSLKHIRLLSNELVIDQKEQLETQQSNTTTTTPSVQTITTLNNSTNNQTIDENSEANRIVTSLVQKKDLNKNSVDLISNLVKILVQLKDFNRKEINAEEIKNLNECVDDVKDNINKNNIELFENNVQIHINYIQTEVNHMGNLGVLAQANSNELYCS